MPLLTLVIAIKKTSEHTPFIMIPRLQNFEKLSSSNLELDISREFTSAQRSQQVLVKTFVYKWQRK